MLAYQVYPAGRKKGICAGLSYCFWKAACSFSFMFSIILGVKNKYCKKYTYSRIFYLKIKRIIVYNCLTITLKHNDYEPIPDYSLRFYRYRSPETPHGCAPASFDAARELKFQEHFILGGAILNDEGQMIGSTMIMQFENDEEQLEAWKQSEPYITQGVWETVDVKPFKVANV
jgi:uncharacterized protein YciI